MSFASSSLMVSCINLDSISSNTTITSVHIKALLLYHCFFEVLFIVVFNSPWNKGSKYIDKEAFYRIDIGLFSIKIALGGNRALVFRDIYVLLTKSTPFTIFFSKKSKARIRRIIKQAGTILLQISKFTGVLYNSVNFIISGSKREMISIQKSF